MFDQKAIKDICVKYNITINQYFILYCLFKRDYKTLTDYVQNKIKVFNNAFANEEIEFLIEQEYIFDLGASSFNSRGIRVYNYTDFMIEDKLSEQLWVDTDDAGRELFKVYPQYLSNKIKDVPTLAKSVSNREEEYNKYAKIIGNNRELHLRVLELIEVGKKKKLILSGISKFIENEGWLAIEEHLEINKLPDGFTNI